MDYDILIAGAGPAGLCFARALAGTPLRLGIVEAQPEATLADPPYDGREIALTHHSARILRELGLWDRFGPEEVSPLRDACVLNGPGRAALRIDHRDSRKDQLGYLISNHVIRRKAYEAVRGQEGLELRAATRVSGVRTRPEHVEVRLAGAEVLTARLLVAADSRFSESRRAVGIPASMRDFGKTMLVCRMEHEKPHEHVAVEWFGYGQTVALLPLLGNACSVVLTLPDQEIRELLALEPEAFATGIEERVQGRLGKMRLASDRHPYPLVGVYPSRLVAHRFAAIGDAAVGMHPVTAHGFNFGLRGLDTLAGEIRAALAAGRDFAAPAPLARYERTHQGATRPLYLATQAIVTLFTNDAAPVRMVRDLLLRTVDRVAPFKKLIANSLTEEHEADRAHPRVAPGAAPHGAP